MASIMENKAIEHINKSGEVDYPDNQEAMPQYFDEKIEYLEDAIDILENQIKEYKKERKHWNRSNMGNSNTDYNSNATVAVSGGKRRKTRKMKKL